MHSSTTYQGGRKSNLTDKLLKGKIFQKFKSEARRHTDTVKTPTRRFLYCWLDAAQSTERLNTTIRAMTDRPEFLYCDFETV